MQKMDAVVAAVGALILVLATAGAALTSDVGGAGARYAASYPTQEVALGAETAPLAAQGSGERTFGFDAPTNLTGVRVRVVVSAAAVGPLAGGASAAATLTAPDGTTYEDAGEVAAPGSSVELVFDVPLAAVPDARVVEAADPGEARARAANASSVGAGAWTLTVTGGAGAPGAASTVSYEAVGTAWTLVVAPEVQPAK